MATSDIFEGRYKLSFLDNRKVLNFANPKRFPASLEYEISGTGQILKNFSAFLLNELKPDMESVFGSVCFVESVWANAVSKPSVKSVERSIFLMVMSRDSNVAER